MSSSTKRSRQNTTATDAVGATPKHRGQAGRNGARSAAQSGPINGAVRYILNRYELSEKVPLPQSIAVVSALRGEGVSTISRSLAEVLAADFAAEVCWIDLAWAIGASAGRPEASPSSVQGIYEVLTGTAALDDVIEQPSDSAFHVLHSGGVPSDQRSALARWNSLQELFEALRETFDYLVLDTGPILSDPDALALMRHADAQILVARHGGVTASQVESISSDLRTVPTLGAILNEYQTHTPRILRRFFAG